MGQEDLLSTYVKRANRRGQSITCGSKNQFLFENIKQDQLFLDSDQKLPEVDVHSGWGSIDWEVEQVLHCYLQLIPLVVVDANRRETTGGLGEVAMIETATETDEVAAFLGCHRGNREHPFIRVESDVFFNFIVLGGIKEEESGHPAFFIFIVSLGYDTYSIF